MSHTPRPTHLGARRVDQLRSLLSQSCEAAAPFDRLSALSQLKRELETLETEAAADALRARLSWSQIGEALGITKQAAHRRHSHDVAKLDQAAQTEHGGRGVIVAGEARQAVRVARREAAAMGEDTVGTEHLLLGLLQCGDAATGELLERLGVGLERARDALQPMTELFVTAVALDGGSAGPARATGRRATGRRRAGSGAAALSPLARHVLEDALGDRDAHPGKPLTALDLLRALLRHDHGGAARTLEMLGVEREVVRSEVHRLGRSPSPA